MSKRIKNVNKRENSVERWVARWANTSGKDYEDGARGALRDLLHGGCMSGMVSELIYTTDVVKFHKRHLEAIGDILTELEDSMGEPLHNQHDLPSEVFRPYVAVEEMAHKLMCEIDPDF